MNAQKNGNLVAAGLLVAIGIAVGGFFVGHGLLKARSSDRYVTVRGLAEREAPADLVVWPIVFTVTADDLATIQKRTDQSIVKIRAFLADEFSDEEISVSQARVTDRQAQGIAGQGGRLERYVAESTVTVRSTRIDTVRGLMELSGELVGQGVALINSYNSSTEYFFTGLDQVKPEMIRQATQDARMAAQKFAEDSGASVGGIRNARQGYFSINDRDRFSPEHKKIRVVTTIEFFLVDD